jgi:hypothetical protein
MYRFAVLGTELEFNAFKHGYDAQMSTRSEGRISSVVKLDYLRAASRTVGCFDASDRLVAGWVVQEADPLIALAAIPELEREAFHARTPREQLCELTAIWRNDDISSNGITSSSYSLPTKYGGEVTTSATDLSGRSDMWRASPWIGPSTTGR